MLDFFFFIFCFLSFCNLHIKGTNEFFNDYIDLKNTNSIKGIFVWLIIFCHKTNYGVKNRYIYKIIISNLGQKVVSMFLFYSGFGILESIKKKGSIYTKSLLKKALILFIKYQIILLMFLFTNIIILKNKISLKRYFLSIFFKLSLGNSTWFALTIILFYIYSYLSFIFTKDKIYCGIIIISFICYFHIQFIFIYFYPNSISAVDNVLCFVIGFYYSYIKIYSDKIIMKNDFIFFLIISSTLFIYYKLLNIYSLLYISIENALFAILVVFISMKIKLNSDFLNFLNFHSFSIYLLQRLVLLIVYKKNLFKNSDFIQISFEFTSIFLLSSIFDKYTIFIDRLIRGKSNLISNIKYIPINNIDFNNNLNKNLISFSRHD